MHRFFVPPSWVQGDRVTIGGPQARQMADVLRLRAGHSVIVLDDSGWELETLLVSVERHRVQGEVIGRRVSKAEPRTRVCLYQGVLRGQRFEIALQKGTELGVAEFVPLISERCVVSDVEVVENKRERWQSIIQEAAEQSKRGRKPALHPAMLLPVVCVGLGQAATSSKEEAALSLFLWEGEEQLSLRDALRKLLPARTEARERRVNLLVGPEGGFAPREAELARRCGLMSVGLGPRVLRAETAGIVAAALVFYEFGDMDLR